MAGRRTSNGEEDMKKRFARAARSGTALGLAVVGLIALAGAGGWGMARAETLVSDVAIVDFDFAPAVFTTTIGSSVAWENTGAFAHTTTSATGAWDSGTIDPGGLFSTTFAVAGMYSYFCGIHPFMQGVIVVTNPYTLTNFLPAVTREVGS
jgi:plastocyanin